MSRAGRRCLFLRKLSRNNRFSALRLTAVGTCLRAIANPMRGHAPVFLPTRSVIRLSPNRILFLKTCWKSIARVNLSRLGKDSLTLTSTLRCEACSAFRSAGSNYVTSAAGLHTRTKAMRSGTLKITGLKCTLHIKRLGSLVCRFQQGATMYC